MIKSLAVVCLSVAGMNAACLDDGKAHSIAGNFSVDLHGVVDNRESSWGTASSSISPLTFRPPAGCRVNVTRVTGDFVAWPMGTVPTGTQAGTLVSIQKAGGGNGSQYADLAADGVLIYLQVGVDAKTGRLAFDQVVPDGVLGADHKLEFKMAEWLNNTGLKIHMEVTWVIVFNFVQ